MILLKLMIKRAQGLSLDMVIGMLILLVVAMVVINLFIKTIKRGEEASQFSWEFQFKEKCEQLCQDYKSTRSIEFCKTRVQDVLPNYDFDWNDNNIKREKIKVGLWEVCEDAIYCFHIDTSCKDILTMEKCRELLCQELLEKYKYYNASANRWMCNYTLANNTLTKIVVPGSCSLPSEKFENWWMSRFNESRCAGVPCPA